MRRFEDRFEQSNIAAVVVSFDDTVMAKAYVNETELKWPLLLDDERRLYRAYGMERGTWWDIYGFISILRYLKMIFTGKKIGRPGKDWRQLGGNVLIDPNGIIQMHHVSQNPHDRPDPVQILRVLHIDESEVGTRP